jgi:hypothetical protein
MISHGLFRGDNVLQWFAVDCDVLGQQEGTLLLAIELELDDALVGKNELLYLTNDVEMVPVTSIDRGSHTFSHFPRSYFRLLGVKI